MQDRQAITQRARSLTRARITQRSKAKNGFVVELHDGAGKAMLKKEPTKPGAIRWLRAYLRSLPVHTYTVRPL